MGTDVEKFPLKEQKKTYLRVKEQFLSYCKDVRTYKNTSSVLKILLFEGKKRYGGKEKKKACKGKAFYLIHGGVS